MDFNHLWFMKCDTLLFSQPLNYLHLKGIFQNTIQFLIPCHQPGLQQDVYQIIQIIDAFFSVERITELLVNKQQIYSDGQVLEIQERTTQFRILIECQKFYANQFWVNKKRAWIVEVRILACLLRIYSFLVKVWELFVGEYPDIRSKMKRQKLILPLNILEPFINDIYAKLQRIETFYYKTEYPYITYIHLLLKSFEKLLKQFPVIGKGEIVRDLKLKLVILCQNEKYKNSYVGKFFYLPESSLSKKKSKVRPRRLTDIVNEEKRKSFDMKQTWDRKFSMCVKVERESSSLELFVEQEPKQPISPNFLFKPIAIDCRSKKNTQESILSGSTRMISDSRSNFLSNPSFVDQFGNPIFSPRETMSPTRLQKASPRRIIPRVQIISFIKQQIPHMPQNPYQQTMKQRQQIYYPLLKYHSVEIRQNRKRARSWKFKIGEQEMEIIGSNPKEHKTEYIEAEIQKLLEAKEYHIKPLKQVRSNRDTYNGQEK